MNNKVINNILLLEDKHDLSEWIKGLLSQTYPNATIYYAENIKEAHSLVKQHDFQLGLLDLGLPDGDGTDIIRALKSQQPACLSIVMTIFDDSDHLFTALKAGAYGYLLKDEDDDDLLKALQGIIDGKPPISPRIAQMMIAFFQKQECSDFKLTDRETDVLTLISKGHSVKKAADLLTISPYTAADHVKQIYQKLNINSRAEATVKAIDLGLLN